MDQLECVAMWFDRGLRPGVNNDVVADGLAGPRQVLWLLQKCCCAVRIGSLMYGSVLFSLKCLAERYPLGPPLGNPLPPFAMQNIGVRWRVCHFSNSLT